MTGALPAGRWLRHVRRALRWGLLLLSPLPAWAADPSPAQLQFFENKIRPIFVNNCYKCHSRQAEKLKAGLDQAYRLQIRNVNPQLGFETLGIEMLSGRESSPR